jgi:hypothetical protein
MAGGAHNGMQHLDTLNVCLMFYGSSSADIKLHLMFCGDLLIVNVKKQKFYIAELVPQDIILSALYNILLLSLISGTSAVICTAAVAA